MRSSGPWIRRLENLVSFSALSLLLLSVLWGVLTRYVTERPAVWTTELSGILFTWVVYIGAMTAFRDGRHIRVTLFIDILPPKLRAALVRLGDLLTAGFLGYVAWLSLEMMQKGASRPSPVLDIPFSWVYLATTIGFAGMAVTATLRLVRPASRPRSETGEDVL